MATVPCPGCASPMELAQEVCGVCRRPRDEGEIEAGRLAVARAAQSRRVNPWRVVVLTVLISGVGAVYILKEPLLARAAAERDRFLAELERTRNFGREPRPGNPEVLAPEASPRAPGGAPPFDALVAEVRYQTRASGPEGAAPPRGAPGAAPAPSAAHPPPAVPASEPPLPVSSMRRYYGVIYDLETLRPVSYATVRVFLLDGTTLFTTHADVEGHYFADIEWAHIDRGALIQARAAGYRAGQLEDPGAPYREREVESRLQTLKETVDEELAAVRLLPGRSPLSAIDLVMLPQRP